MLTAFGKVRRISDPPDYWHDDALLLSNSKGEIQVTLSPKQAGNDLAEFRDSYWRLVQMQGLQNDFSSVVIKFGEGDVSFDTPACFFAYPFEYEMAGLTFSPAWARNCTAENRKSGPDWQIAQVFERRLHSINSYQRTQEALTFFDKGKHIILVLNPIHPTGIETRIWRIEKYRANDASITDTNGLTDAKSRATISLVNGRVGGSPGCGGWEGTYELSGDRLTLNAGVFLAGLCYRAQETQSNVVEKAFHGHLRIEQTDDQILLRNEKGQAEIQLVPF
jgi:heat shock protein HslJ